MGKILVSGLTNIETTVKVEGFPIEYNPINYNFFGVNSTVSGVAINMGKALTTLGDEVTLISMIGNDIQGNTAITELKNNKINIDYIDNSLEKTCQSVVIYDGDGRRQIHCDLKDVQEKSYDKEKFEKALNECDIAALCNINFSRPYLKKAREMGKLVATDVHVISDVNDEYNTDFMKYANILFMSDENIGDNVEDFVREVISKCDNDIIVVGLGAKGALLYVKEDNFMERFNAVTTRKVVNTIGAGDSLFSAFLHYYNKERNPYLALKKAIVFASYKIGESGAAEGFLTEEELDKLYEKTNN